MERLVLIDGHAILHRAFHAYPLLTTTKGELINAVYGFTSILLSVLQSLNPKYVAVAFDLPQPTFRHKQYKKYKAQRPEVDEKLINQIPKTKTVVKALNIPIFEKEGYEADDVIGTIAQIFSLSSAIKFDPPQRQKLEVIIVTGDKDIFQLINENTKVFIPARGKKPAQMIDKERIKKDFGFKPLKIVDFKALVGDQSDNIPGVMGIGPKTAIKLIQQFSNLENIYQHLNEFDSKIQIKLKKGKKKAYLSYKLAKIDLHVPLKFKLAKCRLLDYDQEKVIKLFEELEFRSLIGRLPGMEKQMKNEKIEEKNKQLGFF